MKVTRDNRRLLLEGPPFDLPFEIEIRYTDHNERRGDGSKAVDLDNIVLPLLERLLTRCVSLDTGEPLIPLVSFTKSGIATAMTNVLDDLDEGGNADVLVGEGFEVDPATLSDAFCDRLVDDAASSSQVEDLIESGYERPALIRGLIEKNLIEKPDGFES